MLPTPDGCLSYFNYYLYLFLFSFFDSVCQLTHRTNYLHYPKIYKLGASPLSYPTRWEKFAPGPVRVVTVGPDKTMKDQRTPQDPPEPKRRGRKRKGPEKKPDDVFTGDLVGGGGVTVPMVATDDDALFGADNSTGSIPNEALPPQNPQPAWPTRATFAGRKNTGAVWEQRRAAFYQSIPSSHWKDALERDFWNLCASESTLDDAVQKFLAKEVPSPSDAQPRCEPKRSAKAKAKAKSAAKKLLKEPGKGRGRGRGKGRSGRGHL